MSHAGVAESDAPQRQFPVTLDFGSPSEGSAQQPILESAVAMRLTGTPVPSVTVYSVIQTIIDPLSTAVWLAPQGKPPVNTWSWRAAVEDVRKEAKPEEISCRVDLRRKLQPLGDLHTGTQKHDVR